MLDRRPPVRRGNPRLGLIVLMAIIALVILFQWNQKRQIQQNAEQTGEERLCEVRARLDGHPEPCVFDDESDRWIPKSQATP
jgi:hypothetical protein